MAILMGITRFPDWETRLAAYIQACRGKVFAYGKHDCCTFAAGAVRAMTGHDPMAEFRRRYRTAKGSIRALRRIGRGNLEKTIDAKFPVKPVAQAMRGDLAMHEGSVGVVMGQFVWFVSDQDFARVPLLECSKVWGVGE
jgi:hypothetical protein